MSAKDGRGVKSRGYTRLYKRANTKSVKSRLAAKADKAKAAAKK